jgi:predicted Rossmann fold flavoprotein
VEPRAALVPLTFDGEAWAPYAQLAGLALPVLIETGRAKTAQKSRGLSEDLLFTHRGLSGPAVLQISSFWREGQPVRINLAPGVDLPPCCCAPRPLQKADRQRTRRLGAQPPGRRLGRQDPALQKPISEATDKALLAAWPQRLSDWELTPNGSEGYRKAEVTVGGVDTRDLSSQTLESKQPGLYFIGEVVDVTGWLGGYNFQWAWACWASFHSRGDWPLCASPTRQRCKYTPGVQPTVSRNWLANTLRDMPA